MDKMQLVEEMAEHFYDEYYAKCKNLTDKELQDINLKNANFVGSTPINTDNFQTISRYYAEGMVCKEILEERKLISDATKSWRNELQERKENAILNLPAATSKLGQLIAATLEFNDELSLKEICDFLNVYQEVDEPEIVKILEDLEKEEIIYKQNEKYHILNICTPSLFPENVIGFANNAFKKNNLKLEEKHIEILNLLNVKNVPLSEEDILKNSKFNKYQVQEALSDLKNSNILDCFQSEYIEFVHYFKMLGERRN